MFFHRVFHMLLMATLKGRGGTLGPVILMNQHMTLVVCVRCDKFWAGRWNRAVTRACCKIFCSRVLVMKQGVNYYFILTGTLHARKRQGRWIRSGKSQLVPGSWHGWFAYMLTWTVLSPLAEVIDLVNFSAVEWCSGSSVPTSLSWDGGWEGDGIRGLWSVPCSVMRYWWPRIGDSKVEWHDLLISRTKPKGANSRLSILFESDLPVWDLFLLSDEARFGKLWKVTSRCGLEWQMRAFHNLASFSVYQLDFSGCSVIASLVFEVLYAQRASRIWSAWSLPSVAR